MLQARFLARFEFLRVRTLPLTQAGAEFEQERPAFENAVVVASDPRLYETRTDGSESDI